jgi:hypothetical protein
MMQPYNLEKLYKSFTTYSNEVVLYLPRNSDLNQIARYGQDEKKVEVAHYAIMGASKVSGRMEVLEMYANGSRPCVSILETSNSMWRCRSREGGNGSHTYMLMLSMAPGSTAERDTTQFHKRHLKLIKPYA